jgi:hypothetical protein
VNGQDKAVWYFQAPSVYLSNLGLSYGGYLSFVLSSLSGDFRDSRIRNVSHYVLRSRLWVADCCPPGEYGAFGVCYVRWTDP